MVCYIHVGGGNRLALIFAFVCTSSAICQTPRQPDTALARPKFSLFKPSSELILKKLMDMKVLGANEPPSAVCDVYRRGEELSLDHLEG